MRSFLGLIGILVTLALVGLLFEQQLTANRVPQPLLSTPAKTSTVDPQATAAEHSQQIQNQVKQQVEALTQPKPLPDEVK